MVGKRRSTVAAIAATVLLSHASAATQPSEYQPYDGPFNVILPVARVAVETEGSARVLVAASPQPTPPATPQPRSTPRPSPVQTKPRAVVTRHISLAVATWYCNYTHPEVVQSVCMKVHPDVRGLQPYAAAGPRLRAAIGPGWRNKWVTVTAASGLHILVRLADWCACGGSHVIDLYYDAFEALGSPVNPVTISW